MSLNNKTLFITGASRGIGLAIALRAARDGANIAVVAKTAAPHPKLEGTIHTAAAEIEQAGGKALPLVCDIRFEEQVADAVEKTVARFGGIDICVNNASAIQLTGTLATDMKRFDLMHQINTRGTYLVSRTCIPHLKRAGNPHVLMLSPPLDMNPRWFAGHPAYTMAKYGMSMCVLGMAAEFAGDGIAFNALWPRTGVATAAIRHALAGAEGMKHCRTPNILADAAYLIFNKMAKDFTGHFLIDDTFLTENGVTDLDRYRVDPTKDLMPDFFVPDDMPPPAGVSLKALS
ncbi:MAG: NAD(P)-dependent oxidoreductase [Alphaproteobacteria bacterium]|nr:NAD(P)-dependent oxidoreductase [Alphaproteobacteria bacterium]MBU6472711.1 NAD(P)-dependent oxidoreductase [Alphaproteobacteria bacterium]MDE2013429.1 NAD(P)-dependent oxidoreductase [Alphaproteobacteria bacterium]MDE2073280.1 NAD(P)-dependent oxidoreductase [Alphaproteobacteria bacterium]MDE2351212.1 NAD(P)-dependent oxidoreductase [Alphaproteobacteria bacterium]